MVEEQEWVNCRSVERVDGLRKGSSVVVTGKGRWSVEGRMQMECREENCGEDGGREEGSNEKGLREWIHVGNEQD